VLGAHRYIAGYRKPARTDLAAGFTLLWAWMELVMSVTVMPSLAS